MEEHLMKYVQELINIRTALELEILKLRTQLEKALGINTNPKGQSGPSQSPSVSQPGEVHPASSPPTSPGAMPQGSNSVVDAGGSQVTPAGALTT